MKRIRTIILVFCDIVLINLSYILALYIRFEGNINEDQFIHYFSTYKSHFVYVSII